MDLITRSLELSTTREKSEALALARAAVAQTPKVHNVHPEIVSENADGFEVALKPKGLLGSANSPTTFAVTAKLEGSGTVIHVAAVTYDVLQQKMLFVRMGPKMVPGSKLYSNCLDSISSALSR